ncbi:mycofactocin-coupled SDR family oxidoreductase [Kineococcus sp. TBRC 1896]|uniref:Mycofactocin-coupled SDR family oxidoreductase n=1 Tax=Kineococcus mangrovi TaxID=1660183 RepID=A0ABV4I5Y2_9ACTN
MNVLPDGNLNTDDGNTDDRTNHNDNAQEENVGRFHDQVVFITGGARGQGRAHALAFAREGADIALLDAVEGSSMTVRYDLPTSEDLQRTQEEITALGRRCLAFEGDVRDTAHVQEAVRRTVDELGRLDVAVANAGVFALAPAVDTNDEVWDDVLDINLSGVFRTVRAAAGHMSANGGGSIVTIASMAGRMAFPNAVAYVSAKWGVIGMTKTFAAELGEQGVTVNAVCPTNVETPMLTDNPDAARLFTGQEDPSREEVEQGAAAFTEQGIPWVQPEDVTEAVLFLAGPGARHITGEALTVSAGQIATNAA